MTSIVCILFLLIFEHFLKHLPSRGKICHKNHDFYKKLVKNTKKMFIIIIIIFFCFLFFCLSFHYIFKPFYIPICSSLDCSVVFGCCSASFGCSAWGDCVSSSVNNLFLFLFPFLFILGYLLINSLINRYNSKFGLNNENPNFFTHEISFDNSSNFVAFNIINNIKPF